MPNPEKVWSLNKTNNGLTNMKVLGDSFVMCTVGDSQLNHTIYLRLCEKSVASLCEIRTWELT